MEDDNEIQTFMEHVTEEASLDAYQRDEMDALLSVESLPEHAAVVDFSAFAQDYPEKIFPLLSQLRPEFQELFVEYYVLHKSQSFLGETHGCIQTRIWQALRIIERAIGSLIILGTEPDADLLRSILGPAGFEGTTLGGLSELIARYAKTHNYNDVAKWADAPAPSVRKIFRPLVKILEKSEDLKVAAVGAYLHNLTHQSALTKKAGLSNRAIARLKRVGMQEFSAPPLNMTPVISHDTKKLITDEPWYMFELAADQPNELDIGSARRNYNHDALSMLRLQPVLEKQLRKLFKRDSVEIFAPTNIDGELVYGYLFARTTGRIRNLLKIRGIAFMANRYVSETENDPVLIPNEDVQKMILTPAAQCTQIQTGDFVEVLTGPASRYCGEVTTSTSRQVTVRVKFPTGRKFIVRAHPSSVKKLDAGLKQRAFWGTCS